MKKVLITGGSGFLGKNLAISLRDQFEVVLASRNQSLLKKAAEIASAGRIPMDITNIESVRDAMSNIKPDIVIHAAATKYVDWSEIHPHEAVEVNVLGSINVFRACRDSGVKSLIFISTDKASPPVFNTYGMTKAIAERSFALSSAHIQMSVVCLRYGNVLWSTGSFLHIWEEMAQTKSIITSTGSNMTRFFFSINDATRLVKLSILNAQKLSGSIISLPMKSTTIRSFLEVYCSMYSVKFELVGQRGGERDEEFLVGDAELKFASQISIDSQTLYRITPNIPADEPLRSKISSSSCEKLSESEIKHAIVSKPSVL